MTKQEKIWEGIKQYFKQNWLEDDEKSENMTKDILSYLHSHDVVIKVDRELPQFDDWIITGEDIIWEEYKRKKFREAGYVAVEPLI